MSSKVSILETQYERLEIILKCFAMLVLKKMPHRSLDCEAVLFHIVLISHAEHIPEREDLHFIRHGHDQF